MGEVKLKGGNSVPNAKMKKKHYWWRYLLVWIGASVFTLGAVAAGVYIAGGVVPVKNYINIFANPDEYLTPEYQDQSLFNIIKTVMSGQIDTLEDVNRITPLVETYFEQINTDYVEPNLAFKFDWNEARYVPLIKKSSYAEKDYKIDTSTTLPQYLVDEMKENVKIASLINIETSPYKTLLTYFLYDVERDSEGKIVLDEDGKPVIGSPYSVKDFMNQESKPSSGAYDEVSNAYDPNKEDFFKHVMDNVLDCARVSDFDSEFDAKDPLMSAIQSYTLRDIFDGRLNDLTVGKLFNHEDDKSILAKLFRMTLRELNNFDFNNAKFSDLMDITYPYDSNGELIKGSIKDEEFVYDKEGNVINKEDVSTLMLRTLGEFKMNTIQDPNVLDNYKIGQFIEVDKSADVALSTLSEFTFKKIKEPNFLDSLQLQQIMNIPKEGDANYSPLLDALRENTLGSLKDDKTFKGLRLSNFFTLGELEKDEKNNKVLIALLKIDTKENPVTLGNIGSRVNDVNIGEFMDLGKNPSRLLQTISKKKLPELSNLINDITVQDVLDVEIGSSYHDTLLDKYYFYNYKGEWIEYKSDSEHTAKELFELDYNDLINKTGYYEGVSDEFVTARIKEDILPIDTIKIEEYGLNAAKRNELYDVKDVKFSDPGDFINQIKQRMKLDALVDINDSSPLVLRNLKSYTLVEVADALKNFTLGEMLEIPEGNKLLNSLSTAKLFIESTDKDYIGNRIDKLKISDIMDTTSGPVFLKTIGEYTLNGDNPLSGLNLSTLKFNQIVNYSQFTGGDETGILKELWGDETTGGDFIISEIPGRLMECSLMTILGKQIYQDEAGPHTDSSLLKKQWWYLLTSSTDYSTHNYTNPSGTNYEEPFIVGHLDSGKSLKLNQINVLVQNLQYHFANRSIRELSDAGFLTIDSDTLNKNLGTKKLGDYTIAQLLDYIASL